MGMTALPDAAANAAGGLPISAGGSLALDTKLANTHEITAARMGALTDWIDAGRLDAILDAIAAKTSSLTFTVAGDVDCNVQTWKGSAAADMTGDAYARLGAPTNASISADIVAVKGDTADILTDTSDTLDGKIDDIKTKTDSLTFTVAGDVDCNVQSWKGAAAAAMTGDAYARLGAPAGDSVSHDVAAIKSETASILDDTSSAGVVVAAGSKTGYTLSDAGVDAVFDRNSSLTISFENLLVRLYQMVNNKMEVIEDTGAVSLKNIGASGEIATGNVGSSSGTTTRTELTWA
jgi:hypothetical protein